VAGQLLRSDPGVLHGGTRRLISSRSDQILASDVAHRGVSNRPMSGLLAGSPSARHEPGPLEGVCRPASKGIRSLASIATGDVGRGVAKVSAHLFEGHPVVDEERCGGMADPVRAERPQAPTSRVIAAGEHERDRVHRERLHAVTLAGGDEEPARVGLAVVAGLFDEVGSPALEVREEGRPGLGLQGDVEGLAALAAPEADERPLEVEVLEPQQSYARVASGGRLENRDDRSVAQVESFDLGIPLEATRLRSAPSTGTPRIWSGATNRSRTWLCLRSTPIAVRKSGVSWQG
jgi:hypothetical protein